MLVKKLGFEVFRSMKKITFFVVVLSLIVPTFLIFPGISARVCGEREPVTLLALVRQSDAIHIATFSGQVEGELKKDEGGEMSYREIKRNFDVSSTLKGESVKFVTVPNRNYIYDQNFEGYANVEQAAMEQNPNTAAPPVVEAEIQTEAEPAESEDDFGQKELQPGDSVLLFLKTGAETKEIELVDYVDGIKNLPHADIAVFEARIKEIVPVLAAKKPNAAKIVDWLVRLAEDQVTRWDGAYELEQSFYALEQKKAIDTEQAAQKEKPKDGEENRTENPYNDDSLETSTTTLFASSLSDHHKQTLSNILLNSRFRNASKKVGSGGMVPGDRELMRIVARWGDGRIAGMFIEQLRSGGFEGYDNASLMTHIAAILGDKTLSTLAEKFEEIAYYDDDEEVETDKPNADKMPVAMVQPPEPGTDIAKIDVVKPESTKVSLKAAAKKPVLTYKKVRGELTAKFLKRSEALMAKAQK